MASAASSPSTSPAVPTAPLPRNPQEEAIDLEWSPVEGATGYVVLVRTFPQPMDTAERHYVTGADCKTTVTGLRPTSTYGFRIIAVADSVESEPGPEVTFDTLAADCTPKERKCAVM
jgi:hypothetical protein